MQSVAANMAIHETSRMRLRDSLLLDLFECRSNDDPNYAVGIFLCPGAGLKSCGNTALDRTFQPGRGITQVRPNAAARMHRE